MSEPIPSEMRAVVYRGVNDLRVETLPVPRIRPGELLVKVAVCGICPTDIKKIQHGLLPAPRIFGHETAGTIVRVGGGVEGLRVGDRVALHHHVPCLKCHACRHLAFAQCPTYKRTGITAGFEPAGGGFAEYVRVMRFVLPGVVRIPKRNSFEEGAMLEPVNTVLKGIHRLGLLRGDRVLVIGQGPIGLLFTRLLTLSGAEVVASELLEPRLRLSRRFGAERAVRGDSADFRERVVRWGRGGVDGAVVTVPSDAAVRAGFEMVRGGGKVLLFAHTRRGADAAVDLGGICVDEKDLIGSYSADFTLQEEVSRLVFSRRMDVRGLITHRFPLAETAKAVSLAGAPRPESLKVFVNHGK